MHAMVGATMLMKLSNFRGHLEKKLVRTTFVMFREAIIYGLVLVLSRDIQEGGYVHAT